jgi:hypothetical protein
VAISHCWLSPEHPDPDGYHLRLLAQLLDRRVAYIGPDSGVAIFFDYCSLYQKERTEDEEEVFTESLKWCELWYAHEHTEKWLLTSVPNPAHGLSEPWWSTRGWMSFERSVAELVAIEGVGSRNSLLDIGLATNDDALSILEWPEIAKRCRFLQKPPLVPEAFASNLATKNFSEPLDIDLLKRKYNETFEGVMASTQLLVFCDLEWGDAEAAELAIGLMRCQVLRKIELEGNTIGDAGVGSIMEALSSCHYIETVDLRSNRIGDGGAEHAARAIPKCKKLISIDLSFNVIGNAGASAFKTMFEAGAHPTFQELCLNSNDCGQFMKEQLQATVLRVQGEAFSLSM